MTVEQAFEILRSVPTEWGASEAEVCAVESKLGVALPARLRELMLCTGQKDHMSWLFPEGQIAPLSELPTLRETAFEILQEDDPSRRPAFPFVALSQHQGYIFTFVRADGTPDPEMMSYQEGQGVLAGVVQESLSQFIAAAVASAVGRL